jgi:uncharacterized protein (DUF1684 family)
MAAATNFTDLADYRRLVAELYGRVRQSDGSPEMRRERFRSERDRLFATHPQSALSLEQKKTFQGLHYFDYDPSLRYVLAVDPEADPGSWEVELPEEGLMRLQRFGKVHFSVQAQPVTLTLFWVLGYGGGIFLPFRDGTNQHETYGGGRYLLDTIKGADLGREGDGLVIDFNFAYNPSCAYNFRWVCPLAPRENWLLVPIRAGEWAFP